MYKDKYKVKYLSRKVVLAWKKAADSKTISWQEVFPIICALYELDDNFQKDESFQALNVENQPFYCQFQEILNDLNLTKHDIHYFRKLTKHLLKTYLDVNKELHKLQDQSKNTDNASIASTVKSNKDSLEKNENINTPTLSSVALQNHIPMIKISTKPNYSIEKEIKDSDISINELIIPTVIVEELINFYIELKKADKAVNGDEKNEKPAMRRRRKGSMGATTSNKLSVPAATHQRRRSYSSPAVPVKLRQSIREEGKAVPKPMITPRRNNIPPVTSNRSPSISVGNMKEIGIRNSINISPKLKEVKLGLGSPRLSEMTIGMVSPVLNEMKIAGRVSPRLSEMKIAGKNTSPRLTEMGIGKISPRISSLNSPLSAITSPNSASTVAANDILSTNYMYSPVYTPAYTPAKMAVNKKIVPPANANVITVKHSKKSKLRKIKKMSLRVATNIVLKGAKEPNAYVSVSNNNGGNKENEEFGSQTEDSFSCNSAGSQTSFHRIEDVLLMSPINTDNLHEDSLFSATTAVFPGFNPNPITNSSNGVSASQPVPNINPYPPRNVSLTRSRKSISILSPNASIVMNNPMNRSNRFEDYLYSSATTPSLASSSQTLNGYNSPSLSQSQSQSQYQSSQSQTMIYGSSPSLSSPFMGPTVPSSATNIFNKDNLYRFKENSFSRFSNGNGRIPEQTSVPVPYRKKSSSAFSPFVEPLPSLPVNDIHSKSKFNPMDEPLPPFPPSFSQKTPVVDDNVSYSSLSQRQSQSQSQNQSPSPSPSPSQSQSQNQSFNVGIPSQLLSQSSLNSSSNYNGLSFMEEQLLEEDDFEVNEILNKYNGLEINSQNTSRSNSFVMMPGSGHVIRNSNSNSTLSSNTPLLFKNNNVNNINNNINNININNNHSIVEGKNHPLFKNNGLTLEGEKFVNASGFVEDLEGDIEVPSYMDDMTEDMEAVDTESVQRFEEQLQRDVKELEEVAPYETSNKFRQSHRIHDEEEEGEEESTESEYDERQTSTIITDTSVIDSLESDLLNHKVQARKSSMGLTPKSSFKLERLSSIDEGDEVEEEAEAEAEDEGELSDHTIVDETKAKEAEDESVDDDRKVIEEQKKKLDSMKKSQFRLSFLTSKSSCHSLKDAFKKGEKSGSSTETETETETENDTENESEIELNNKKFNASLNKEEEEEQNETELKEKAKEEKEEEEEEEEEEGIESIVTPTPKTINLSNIDKKHILSSSLLTSISKINENKEISNTTSGKTNTEVYFVHPVQLYNIIQMIFIYTVAKLPKRAIPITQHWMAATNDMAIGFWDILKSKEDIISNIIIYSTFYDHVKVKTFPLNDPNHVFLKELVSSTEKNQEQENKEEKEVILKEKPKLAANTRNSNFYQKEYTNTTPSGENYNNFENQATNKKLIMEIKKELLI